MKDCPMVHPPGSYFHKDKFFVKNLPDDYRQKTTASSAGRT